ncbi:hypothetical protein [Pseudomonas lopnurensis]|uniref:hypothetical protein n=1 Tax=Pseudomonas lopnurensis TaxID=1477517 RepID=UPI0028AD3565|nr:hypothetical protein [Pseudomonas lopnurensis]
MNHTYPERLPALLAIAEHAARSELHYTLNKGVVDAFSDAGLSIWLYDLQPAIEALAQADIEHSCDSSDSPTLRRYALVQCYQTARSKEAKLYAHVAS